MDYQRVIHYMEQHDYSKKRTNRLNWDNFLYETGLNIDIPYIHISGSNSKESVRNYLSNIYEAAGYKVGTFSSMYLKNVTECIKINGNCIKEARFAEIFNKYKDQIEIHNLSLTEILVCIAYEFFNIEKPDIVIIETLTSNDNEPTIIQNSVPVLSIITDVCLNNLDDSIKDLSTRLVSVAKSDIPCLTGYLNDESLKIVSKLLKKKKSELVTVDKPSNMIYSAPYYYFSYSYYEKLSILSPAKYLVEDACIAIEAVSLLQGQFPVNEYQLRNGLLSKPLKCKFEKIENVVFDATSNSCGVKNLISALKDYKKDKDVHIMFSTYKDNSINTELRLLGNETTDITLTTFDDVNARKQKDFMLFDDKYNFNDDFRLVISNYIAQYPYDIIVVTGCMNFVYQVREYLCKILHYDE